MLTGGARVCVPYAVLEEAEALRGSLAEAARPRLHTAAVDVADAARFDAFASDVRSRFGRIDVLVNGVGGFAGGDLASTTPDLWNRMLTLNLTTTYIACHAVLPAMLQARSGRVISIGSRAVVPPAGGFTAYTVAKAGVIALTQSAALENGPSIRVNCVSPGVVRTPMSELLFRVPKLMEPFDAAIPAGRAGTAEDVADVVLFLVLILVLLVKPTGFFGGLHAVQRRA